MIEYTLVKYGPRGLIDEQIELPEDVGSMLWKRLAGRKKIDCAPITALWFLERTSPDDEVLKEEGDKEPL